MHHTYSEKDKKSVEMGEIFSQKPRCVSLYQIDGSNLILYGWSADSSSMNLVFVWMIPTLGLELCKNVLEG